MSAVCFSQLSSAPAGQRQTALALERAGKIEAAQTAWKALLAIQPGSAEAYAHLGLLEAHQERYKEAIANYRKALALNPKFPNLAINLGLSLFKAGELKEALQIFEPMLRNMPVNSPQRLRVVTLTGLAHYGLGNYVSAVPYMKQATAGDPQNLQFKLMLAHACMWSKQFQCVLDAYREILTVDANSAEAHMLAGEAYDGQRNESKALEEFKAAIDADPKLPNVHFGYGYMLWRLLKLSDAEQEFAAELANDPEHPLSLTYMGDTKIRLGHVNEAGPYLEHAIRLDPSITLAHLDIGTVYDNQGRKEDALRELKLAADLAPGDQKIHWRLAQFYQSMGRRAEAKAEFAKTQTLQKSADESALEKIRNAKPRLEEQPLGVQPN